MKLRLTVNTGTLAGRVYELESGFLTIGRGENCSIRLDPKIERIASKQHAFVEAKSDGFYLTDNKSLNGTLVNGEKIQRTQIHTGDTIEFGRKGVSATVQIERSSTVPDQSAAQFQQIQQVAEQHTDNLQNSMSNIGLGQLEAVPEPSRTGRYVGIGFTIFAIVFLALIVVALMFLSVGIVPAVIAAIVAFIPAVIYLFPLIWLDRYDPEPLWLLGLAFAWGALVAVIFSIVVNSVVSGVVEAQFGMDAGIVVGGVFSAPIFEESSKGIGLLILLIFFRKYFDDILDGIVFAGVIALGFATVENVQYYGTILGQNGIPALILLFFMRGVLSPFAHVTFTSMTGIGCGIARESHRPFVRIIAPILGYCGAVFLHALWNGLAILGGFESFVMGYLFIEIPFFLIFVTFAFYIMYRQNKILKEMLAIDIARGLIPKEHGDIAVSAFKSSAWLIGGLVQRKVSCTQPLPSCDRKIGAQLLAHPTSDCGTGSDGKFSTESDFA
jgi:RsiW-degrading membrane proteinase PrsW (M82 family)